MPDLSSFYLVVSLTKAVDSPVIGLELHLLLTHSVLIPGLYFVLVINSCPFARF